MAIKMSDGFRNYPIVEGAGALGKIVNKRWADQWVQENNPSFASFDSMAIDILVEDYNERHKTELAAASTPNKPNQGDL